MGTGGSGTGGTEIILTGAGGQQDAGAGSTGTDAGTSTGTGGSPVKAACGASSTNPLPYTDGYTADPLNRSMAMSNAAAMTTAEQAQQMGARSSPRPTTTSSIRMPTTLAGFAASIFATVRAA